MAPQRAPRPDRRSEPSIPLLAFGGRPVVDVQITRLRDGGQVEVARRRAHLTTPELALVVALAARTSADAHVDDAVRGYAPTAWLVATLRWTTATPSANHVRQVLRRTRAAFARGGIGDLFESRRHFGYRLRVIPGPGSTGLHAFGDVLR